MVALERGWLSCLMMACIDSRHPSVFTQLPATPPCVAAVGAPAPHRLRPGAVGEAALWNAARSWCAVGQRPDGHQHQPPGPPRVSGLPLHPPR